MAAMLAVGAMYLIVPYLDARYKEVIWNISSSLPVLFWLMCQFGFYLRPRISAFWGITALYVALVPLVAGYFNVTEPRPAIDLLVFDAPKYLGYILVLHGLSKLFTSWKGGILECSNALRLAFLFSLGVTGIWFLSSRSPSGESSEALLVAISFCCMFTGVILLKGREDILAQLHISDTPRIQVLVPQKARDAEATRKLLGIMEAGFYRTENLTIKGLAREIQVPEYKIRLLITTSLGYRNFSDYVNHMRIKEAGERLLNEPETPIRNISTDVGYRTLSSFNRAFKDIFLTTPTEFRLSGDTSKGGQSQLVGVA